MSKGVNKVILVGNLGADPDVRFLPSGDSVVNATLATSEIWKDRQSGEKQERTEWHRLVFFNRLAEIAGEYLKKGSKIYAEGSLKTRKWTDKNGVERYTTEIVVSEMQMLDSRQGGPSSPPNPPSSSTSQSSSPAPAATTTDFSDDDVPF